MINKSKHLFIFFRIWWKLSKDSDAIKFIPQGKRTEFQSLFRPRIHFKAVDWLSSDIYLSLNSFQTHSENCAFTMKIKNENTSEIVSENTWWQTSIFFFFLLPKKQNSSIEDVFVFFSCLHPSWFALKFKLRPEEINDANHSNTVWWFLIKITIESNQIEILPLHL